MVLSPVTIGFLTALVLWLLALNIAIFAELRAMRRDIGQLRDLAFRLGIPLPPARRPSEPEPEETAPERTSARPSPPPERK